MGQRHARPVDTISPVMTATTILKLQSAVRDIHVHERAQGYIQELLTMTRTLPAVSLGASPRGSLNLRYACQARAAIQGRNYVKPDDVKVQVTAILAHRIVVRPEHRIRGMTAQACVQDAMNRVPV